MPEQGLCVSMMRPTPQSCLLHSRWENVPEDAEEVKDWVHRHACSIRHLLPAFGDDTTTAVSASYETYDQSRCLDGM
jgi:hypothetical protein